MNPEELNKILLHAVPNSWAQQSYIQEWDFEERSYKETCDMFEHTETTESIYKGGATSKNTPRAEVDHASSVRKKNG